MLLAALALCSFVALPAVATATVVPNACQYSLDAYYRDMPIGLAGSPTITPLPPRYPAPGTVADAGQTIQFAGQPVSVTLPTNLPRFGYQAGLLHEGFNSLQVNVWVAIRATNTVEGVRIVGPLTVTATTTINVEPSDLSYISDTGFAFAAPVLPDTTWTATGGDVVFSQAEAGTLGSLPVGNGGVATAVTGSIVIQAVISPTVSFFMDCRPGVTQNVNPTDGAGPTFAPTEPAPPIDSSITGPRNVSCISNQGRLASDAAANLPAGSGTREIDPIDVALSSTGNPAEIPVGATYTVANATAQVTLSAGTAATLGRQLDGATPLVAGDTSYPLDMWLTLAATNTVEGTQTVHVSGTYTVPAAAVGLPNGTAGPEVVATLALPPTTWTPSGSGTIRVSAAPPGSMGPVDVTGNPASDPLGAPAATTYSIAPFGSILLRGGTERNPVTFDCAPAIIDILDPATSFSNLGRTQSAARYSMRPNPRPDALATTRVPAPLPPAAVVPASDLVVSPPLELPGPRIATAPPVAAPVVSGSSGPGKFGFTKLKVNKGKISVVVSCASSRTTCAGTLQIRTATKQRLTARGKPKLVTIARNTRYAVPAGKLKTSSSRSARTP